MLTDTHCHLDLEPFDQDRDAVLARARAAGLVRLLIPAIDLDGAEAAIAYAAGQTGVFCAVGVHPNSGAAWSSGSPERLKAIAANPNVVAVGEIGLDYYWDTTPHDLQQRILLEQLDLAAEIGLPVVIHDREATADVLDILLTWQAGMAADENPLSARPGVLHSFSGDAEDAARAMAAGFYIGITGPVTFKNAPELQALVADLPLDRLLIETDAPYLTPHPFRGKRNEPARVRLVAEKIAALQGVSIEQVLRQTYANSVMLFQW